MSVCRSGDGDGATSGALCSSMRVPRKALATPRSIQDTARHCRAVKPIEAIQVGDLVWAWDQRIGQLVAQRVTRLFRRKDQAVLEVVCGISDGRVQVICGTTEHPFWVQGKGWTPSGALAAGDVLKGMDGEGEIRVLAVYDSGRKEDVFNFEVENAHNYFVGKEGVLVHNMSVFPGNRFSAWVEGTLQIPTRQMAAVGAIRLVQAMDRAYIPQEDLPAEIGSTGFVRLGRMARSNAARVDIERLNEALGRGATLWYGPDAEPIPLGQVEDVPLFYIPPESQTYSSAMAARSAMQNRPPRGANVAASATVRWQDVLADDPSYTPASHQLPEAPLLRMPNGAMYLDLRKASSKYPELQQLQFYDEDGVHDLHNRAALEEAMKEAAPAMNLIAQGMGDLPGILPRADYVGPTPVVPALHGATATEGGRGGAGALRDVGIVALNQRLRDAYGINGAVLAANLLAPSIQANGGRLPSLQGDFEQTLSPFPTVEIQGTNNQIYWEHRGPEVPPSVAAAKTPSAKAFGRLGYKVGSVDYEGPLRVGVRFVEAPLEIDALARRGLIAADLGPVVNDGSGISGHVRTVRGYPNLLAKVYDSVWAGREEVQGLDALRAYASSRGHHVSILRHHGLTQAVGAPALLIENIPDSVSIGREILEFQPETHPDLYPELVDSVGSILEFRQMYGTGEIETLDPQFLIPRRQFTDSQGVTHPAGTLFQHDPAKVFVGLEPKTRDMLDLQVLDRMLAFGMHHRDRAVTPQPLVPSVPGLASDLSNPNAVAVLPSGRDEPVEPVRIHQAKMGAFGNNVYLVEGPSGVTMIDAAPDPLAAARYATEKLGKPLAAVLFTHGHRDHMGSPDGPNPGAHTLAADPQFKDVPLIFGRPELRRAVRESGLPADRFTLVDAGDTVSLGGVPFEIMAAFGAHTEGSILPFIRGGQPVNPGNSLIFMGDTASEGCGGKFQMVGANAYARSKFHQRMLALAQRDPNIRAHFGHTWPLVPDDAPPSGVFLLGALTGNRLVNASLESLLASTADPRSGHHDADIQAMRLQDDGVVHTMKNFAVKLRGEGSLLYGPMSTPWGDNLMGWGAHADLIAHPEALYKKAAQMIGYLGQNNVKVPGFESSVFRPGAGGISNEARSRLFFDSAPFYAAHDDAYRWALSTMKTPEEAAKLAGEAGVRATHTWGLANRSYRAADGSEAIFNTIMPVLGERGKPPLESQYHNFQIVGHGVDPARFKKTTGNLWKGGPGAAPFAYEPGMEAVLARVQNGPPTAATTGPYSSVTIPFMPSNAYIYLLQGMISGTNRMAKAPVLLPPW